MKLTVDGKTFDVAVSADEVTVDGTAYRVRTEGRGALKTVFVNEQPFRVVSPLEITGSLKVLVDAQYHQVRIVSGGSTRRAAPAERRATTAKASTVKGGVLSAMAGRILRVVVEARQAVKAGDLLLVFEAMKMENEVRAAQEGTVTQVAIKSGDRVNAGDLMLVIE